ncbi:MAG: tRNA (adenosine(37)-N6)-threonylcarbamoyltransferase complex dimerization subunit type 1 TsaB [Anaerolineales bacterium]|jgi:tRNA threonylcarbamoyladenosine biosynthesis protein TsaB
MLLAIDCASRKIGVALYDDVEVLHEAVWHSVSRHTVELSPAIVDALDRRGKTIEDIGVIAISIGPGSYTGLRIGAAVAKGIALAQRIPLIGVLTFDILAAAQPVMGDQQLAVVLEAGRGRLAVGWYESEEGIWQASGKPDLLTPEAFIKKIRKPTRVCGELSKKLRKKLSRKWKNVSLATPAESLRRPSFLAELAWVRWQDGDVDDPVEIAPYYLQTGEKIPA